MNTTCEAEESSPSLNCQVRPLVPSKFLQVLLVHNIHAGPQGYDEAISFANWDVFWYTRGFNSMDTERSRRHASKLLTFPITIGSVLHQHSSLMLNNQRLTPEGSRSMAGKLTLFRHRLPAAKQELNFQP